MKYQKHLSLRRRIRIRNPKRTMRKFKHIVEYILFVTLFFIPAMFPLSLTRKMGEVFGTIGYHLWSSRRNIALTQMREAIERGAIVTEKTAEELIKENFSQIGRVMAETVKIYFGFARKLIDEISIEGLENFEEAKSRNKGVIFVFSHSSNWELMISISEKIGEVWGVGRRQSNPYIDSFIMRARIAYGANMVYKEGAVRKYIGVLRKGGTVTAMMDQAVIRGEGVLIDFLGKPARTSVLPIALARRTGAAIVPIFIRMTNSGYVINIHKEVPLVKGNDDDAVEARAVTKCIEDYIQDNPTQWLWIHRRWKNVD
jgi:KDO2-lipid IV(A) lauroyltransferase